MSRRLALPLVLLALLHLAVAASAEEGAERRAALREAQEPLRDRNWPAAVTALHAFREEHPGTDEAIEAEVLEARATLLAGKPREALDLTSAFLERHGASAWAGRMRFTAADAYVALQQPEQAAATLRERVDATTAEEARAAVAALHLALADADFDGADTVDDLGRTVKQRNVQRALDAYRHALVVGVAPDREAHARERVALCLEELKQFAPAADAWNDLLQEVEQGKRVVDSETHERWMVGRARARLHAGQADEARKDLRQVLEQHPTGKLHMEVLLLLGEERLQAGAHGDDVAFEEGVTWIRRAVLEHRDDERAAEAQKRLASAYESHALYEKAAAEWAALVERFPDDDFAPEARDRQGTDLMRAGRFDEAAAAWERFLAAHPNHPLWQKVREHVLEAAFAKGQALADAGEKEGAIAAWRAFADAHPADARAPEVLLRAGALDREAKDADAAIALWRQVGGRYASTAQAPRAGLLIAETLEDDLGRLADAVKAYEELIAKYASAPEAQEAKSRLERLKALDLELRLEKVVGTKQAPTIHVATRNLKSLDVRVYRLELAEYFRRKGTVLGVENLQLEVVKPDRTAKWDLGEDYVPFARIEADRPLPVEGPGAYVVVAGDEHLTATSLFLVSDAEIVVKKARGEHLFVWAFARETQAPLAGATVLVAEGDKVREVGRTGADGVWQGEAGANAGHVLVLADCGPAATEVGPGPAVASGFQSKAYVYTSAPVYRPGQEVGWRAIFLRATGGAYEAPRARKGTVQVIDARGQTVLERPVESSDFGTFAGTFPLDLAAPVGVWKVQLAVKPEGSWTGEFSVQEFKKPEFTLDLEPLLPHYLTGEKVEVKAKLAYAFGAPVVDVPLAYEIYRVPHVFAPSAAEDYGWYFRDERREDEQRKAPRPQGTLVARGEARTDDGGVAVISFQAEELDEDSEYVVRVAAQDVTRRWVVDEGRIPVTRRDHMAVVKTERKVYRPNQEMTVEVRTVDALEHPVARSGRVLLLELRKVRVPAPAPETDLKRAAPVAWQETEVERAAYPVSTDASGRAELRLEVPGPGRWRLRWKATDARGALVTAFTDVEATGEAEDPTRDARLVAAKTLYTEGDEAEVLLRSPVSGVKALLTYEAERVLRYVFVDVQGGSTLLSLPVRGEDAPNVFFKIAIPHGDRLLEAETEIVVLRTLQVDVKLPATAAPGEKVHAEVLTRDARGRPVAAEVGVALIDETLYAVAPDLAPAIRPYFYDRRRQNAVVTASSLGFHAYGTTRETNQDLLADAAARHGDLKLAMAESALRNAQEALARNDVRTAVRLALKAAEDAPDLYAARAFLALLRENQDARKSLARVDRSLLEELQRTAPMDPAPERAEKSKSADKKGEWADEEAEDELKDAPYESASKNGYIGIGGGAGGSFGGRGGHRARSKEAAADERYQPAVRSARIALSAADRRQQLLEQMRSIETLGLDAGFLLEVRKRFADVATWQSRVVTGADGRATVEVELPDNLTTWRAVVRGVSQAALVGEGRGRLLARRDLVVRVDTPRFLVQGDKVTIPVAVHNDGDHALEVQESVTVEGADVSGATEGTHTLQPGAHAVSDVDLEVEDAAPVRIEARATAGTAADAAEARFPAIPCGIKTVEGRSGVADTARGALQETTFDVPWAAVPGATRLAVVLYPGLDAALLDALLYLDMYPYGCIEQTVHRFLPALDARAALLAAGSPAAARLEQLDDAVARSVARLRNLQQDDGSFGWFRGGGSLSMTAYALLGLSGARAAGVPDLDRPLDRATQALRRLVQGGREDERALAHLALASVGVIETDAYGSTFRRRRDDLSVAGLAWMAMAAKTLGRGYDADELADLIVARRVEEDGSVRWKGVAGDCFTGSDREATGLAVKALLVTGRGAEQAERGLAWLFAHRVDGGFGSTKDTSAFVGAASAWVTTHGAQAFGGTLDVLLDGTVVRTIAVGPEGIAAADRRFLVPEAAKLASGSHKLGFRLKGQGRLQWAARLEAVAAHEGLPGESNGLSIERTWLRPEEAPVEGQPPPAKPGYEILRPAARPKIEARALETVGIGDKVLVRLELSTERDLEYVLVEDPLPAGFDVLEDTPAGPFDWQERRDDRMVFFCTKLPKGKTVLSYVVQATHWGRFTALGTTAYAMYLPEVHGRAQGGVLSVAPGGTGRTDAEHPPTPDEMYARAKGLFDEGKASEAAPTFHALLDEQPLCDEIVEEIESYLLRGAIEANDAREIVRAREALVRRNPARIPDDWRSARRIAFAYHTLGEFEMASGLYRDLVARGFGLWVDWMQTLTKRGREVDGLDALGKALEAFPVSNATADAAFRRSQRYRELPRPEGREGTAGRPMDDETLDALWSFTAHFAETPLADPAGYALIDAQRRAGDLEGAATSAEAFLRRFPGSDHEDDAFYFLAETRFRTFERDPTAARAEAVRQAARPLVERDFPGRGGRPGPSEFRSRAWYVLARLEHVLGHLDEAIRDYDRARDVEDAREAYAFLTEERLDLDETFSLPLEGGAALPLRYRNVAKAAFKIYPVDLQVLFAVRKRLEGLHDVDLSGIVPARQWDVAFDDAKDHLGHRREVPLPVEEGKPGAWLVVVKAGDHEAKTLVVKSDLRLVLQRVGDKVRVYVTDPAGEGVRDAYVTVADGDRVRARGLTDGRGIFEAPGVGEGVAVLVSKGDRYAIAR